MRHLLTSLLSYRRRRSHTRHTRSTPYIHDPYVSPSPYRTLGHSALQPHPFERNPPTIREPEQPHTPGAPPHPPVKRPSTTGDPTMTTPPEPPENPPHTHAATLYRDWLVHAASCKGTCRMQGVDCEEARHLREEYRAASDAMRAFPEA
ncbi:hypothetical protein a10_08046 [Streptomyces acidiscabies]|nr:hypothetical protein a10_08046 [Streptomyces acidiscabies]